MRPREKTPVIFFGTVLLLAGMARGERAISAGQLEDRVRGFWLGQLIGNSAGRSTEGKYGYASANPNESVPWVLKQTWDADDDTDIEYLAVHILETDGFGCGAEVLRGQWLEHITSRGIYIANRQSWFLMGDGIVPPATGSRAFNMHWYSIDSQITTEVLGVVCPGMVQEAVDLAGRFASISNEGFAVHAAELYAAMNAAAFFEHDVTAIVQKGLEAIPATSRTHEVAADVLRWYLEDVADGQADWRATRRRLYDHYQGVYSRGRYYNWLESTINTGATVVALLYGQGDFEQTVQIAVLEGWDCDCNPATAGGLIGIIKGFSGLPTDLTDPAVCGDTYVNVFRPGLPQTDADLPQYDSISNIARRVAELAGLNIVAYGGYASGVGPGRTWHLADEAGGPITRPEKPDPQGPGGLVRDALEAGLTVEVSAAVENDDTDDDRRNLEAIIDGIKDNSYNGHKAYWSYTSSPEKPERDWYALTFSKPVLLNGVTFYEGDFVWDGINDRCQQENARGGFFEDLTVEVLKDGAYVVPVNLAAQTALDPCEMYQTIAFSFSPVVASVVRVIGKAGGSMRYTTVMELEASGSVQTGLYIAGVRINEGRVQRSDVRRLEVCFNEPAVIGADAFRLVAKGLEPGPGVRVAYDAALNRAVLTFDADGNGEFGDSLLDGWYELQIDCSMVVSEGGEALLDDDRMPHDGRYSVSFARLFGDADGSGRIDICDFAALCGVWECDPGATGLDIDGDGEADARELAALGDRWLRGVGQ